MERTRRQPRDLQAPRRHGGVRQVGTRGVRRACRAPSARTLRAAVAQTAAGGESRRRAEIALRRPLVLDGVGDLAVVTARIDLLICRSDEVDLDARLAADAWWVGGVTGSRRGIQ